MRILVNSDKNIPVDASAATLVRSEVRRVLDRFTNRLTRVEIHLSDENSGKSGARDKRCLVEARPTHRRPLTSQSAASTVEASLRGALSKMRNALGTVFGKVEKKKKTPLASIGRSPKKKAIYRARRKAWPAR